MVIKLPKVDCNTKKRYPTEKMADDFANAYNKDIFLKEKDRLTTYFCNIHSGWHVGHHKVENLPPHIRVHRLLDEIKKNET